MDASEPRRGRSGGSAQRTAPFDFRFRPPSLLCGSDRSWLVHTTTYTAGTLIGRRYTGRQERPISEIQHQIMANAGQKQAA